MTHPTDLPTALPLAIAAGLLALVVAPWLGGSEAEACTPTAGRPQTSDVDRGTVMLAGSVESAGGSEGTTGAEERDCG